MYLRIIWETWDPVPEGLNIGRFGQGISIFKKHPGNSGAVVVGLKFEEALE